MTPLLALVGKDLRSHHNLGHILRRQSGFKVAFILLFAAVLLGGLFALFLDGFRFLSSLGGAGFMITRHLFALFFLGLSGMLLLSGIVTSYSTIFRSRDIPFLLSTPLETRDLIVYKSVESALLSSWAFFFITLPFAAAYAWHEKLGLVFGLWTLLFSIPLLSLCSGLGTLISLLLVRWFPRRYLVPVLFTALAGVLLWTVFASGHAADAADSPSFAIGRLIPGLKVAAHPLSPSWWVAQGILSCAGGRFGRGLLLWAVIASNALLVSRIVAWTGEKTFYAAYQKLSRSGSATRRRAVLLGFIEDALSALRRDTRALLMKDLRTFLRDPMQWSQAVIFFGLLAMYFGSIRSFHYNRLPEEWRNLIAFLNVFSVAAVLCSLTSRFVFPQLSMEGHAFWVLGLSPTTPKRILTTKFVLAALGTLAVSVGLMLLSTRTLQVDPLVRWITLALVVSISCAVCALSTGLGAVFLDLKQSNPMAIVSSLGGTINLVMSLSFMLAAILPFGLLFHLLYLGRIAPHQLQSGLAAAGAWLALITAAAVIVPLRLGYRSMLMRDY